MGAPKLTRRFRQDRAKALRPQQTELQRLIAKELQGRVPGTKPSRELMAEVIRVVEEMSGEEASCKECGAREIDRGAPFTQHPGCPFA